MHLKKLIFAPVNSTFCTIDCYSFALSVFRENEGQARGTRYTMFCVVCVRDIMLIWKYKQKGYTYDSKNMQYK